jgi:hypothetical protein
MEAKGINWLFPKKEFPQTNKCIKDAKNVREVLIYLNNGLTLTIRPTNIRNQDATYEFQVPYHTRATSGGPELSEVYPYYSWIPYL